MAMRDWPSAIRAAIVQGRVTDVELGARYHPGRLDYWRARFRFRVMWS